MLYPIIEHDVPTRPLVIDAQQLKRQLYGDREPARKTSQEKSQQGDILVVDLHASEVLDTTAGMSSADILNYQLDVFRRTLDEHKNAKGKKIVFIHGKGEGVLRQALIQELRYKYKKYTYQDASFQEYGYGATQVTIR